MVFRNLFIGSAPGLDSNIANKYKKTHIEIIFLFPRQQRNHIQDIYLRQINKKPVTKNRFLILRRKILLFILEHVTIGQLAPLVERQLIAILFLKLGDF